MAGPAPPAKRVKTGPALHGSLSSASAAKVAVPKRPGPVRRSSSDINEEIGTNVLGINSVLKRIDVDGRLFSSTPTGEKFLDLLPTMIDDSLLESTKELMDHWELDPKHATKLEDILIRSLAKTLGTSLDDARNNRNNLLRRVKTFNQGLRESFEATHKQYDSRWLQHLMQKVDNFEKTPVMVASTLFATLTDYPATAFLRDRYTKFYLPYLHDQLREWQQRILYRDKHESLTKVMLDELTDQRAKLFKLFDVFFESLMPSAGLDVADVTSAANELEALSSDRNSLLASGIPGITTRKEMISEVYTILPADTIAMSLFSRLLPPWIDKINLPEGQQSQRPTVPGDPQSVAHILDRRNLRLFAPTLQTIFVNSLQVILRGTLPTTDHPGTDLSISGDFLTKVKSLLDLEDNVATNEDQPFIIDLHKKKQFSEENILSIREHYSAGATRGTNEIAILLGPYIEGTFYEPSEKRIRYLSEDAADEPVLNSITSRNWAPIRRKIVKLFTDINQTLLDPIGGLWNTLQLNLNPTKNKDNAASLRTYLLELETERVLTIRKKTEDESGGGSAAAAAAAVPPDEKVDELVNILHKVDTGVRLSELINMINSSQELVTLLEKNDEVVAYWKLLKQLQRLTQTKFDIDDKDSLIPPMPIQYYYDGRAGLAFAVVEYSYLRSALQVLFTYIAEPLMNSYQIAKLKHEKAQREVIKENEARETQVDTLRTVSWDLEPINLPKLSFDPVVERCLELAYDFIKQHSANSINWSDRTILQDIAVNEILNDKTPEGRQAFTFLLKLAAWQHGQTEAQMMSKKPKTATNHHLNRAVNVEAEWIARAEALTVKWDRVASKYRLVIPPF